MKSEYLTKDKTYTFVLYKLGSDTKFKVTKDNKYFR